MSLGPLALVAAQGLATCPKEVVEPERVFTGIFVDKFEAQVFHENAADPARLGSSPAGSWMTFDLVGLGRPFGITRRGAYGAYRVTFRGIRRSRPPHRFPCGYGHLGANMSTIDMTRLLAIEPIGAATS